MKKYPLNLITDRVNNQVESLNFDSFAFNNQHFAESKGNLPALCVPASPLLETLY